VNSKYYTKHSTSQIPNAAIITTSHVSAAHTVTR